MAPCLAAETRKWLAQWPRAESMLNDFESRLKRRTVTGSHSCALATAQLLRNLIGSCRWQTATKLMKNLRGVALVLSRAQPMELATGNVVRRVLLIVRQEYDAQRRTANDRASPALERSSSTSALEGMQLEHQPSLHSTLAGSRSDSSTNLAMLDSSFTVSVPELRTGILDQLQELLDEIETSMESIAESALSHVHANEVILTIGHDEAVLAFLTAAAKKRSFSALVAEGAPGRGGHATAAALARAGVDVTLVPDACVFVLMSRVHKVLLPAHAVVADGGLVTPSGCHAVAVAAKNHAVPVVCVTGLYKLCPAYPHDLDALNEMGSPEPVLPYRQHTTLGRPRVLNPLYDFVPPDLVELYVTNSGSHQPSYIYRLLAEYYHLDDMIEDIAQ